jgi:hypothetical protein
VVVRAVEVDSIVPKLAVNDLELLREAGDPFLCRRELEAVRVVLAFHPAGADSKRYAPAGDLVRGRRGPREHRGVAERARRDERPELELRRAGREAGDRRPRVQDGPLLVGAGDVVVGAEQGLDAVFLAGGGERDPVLPGHSFLALDHQCEAHGRRR